MVIPLAHADVLNIKQLYHIWKCRLMADTSVQIWGLTDWSD